MRTYAICPISDKKINERVARLNAISTVLLLGLYLLTSNVFVVIFLLVDFLVRSLELSHYSPLALLSRTVASMLNLAPKPINAGPKIFAARIGLVFSIAIFLSILFGLKLLALSLVSVFGACALLEATIGFCLACEIYPFVLKFQNYIKQNRKS